MRSSQHSSRAALCSRGPLLHQAPEKPSRTPARPAASNYWAQTLLSRALAREQGLYGCCRLALQDATSRRVKRSAESATKPIR